MQRVIPIVIFLVMLSACGPSQAAAGTPYRLYTHCGVVYADFDGRRFYAEPPAGDGSGNPPPRWGNPYDDGTMTLLDPDTAVFTDPAGNRAVFSTHPARGIPTIYPCD